VHARAPCAFGELEIPDCNAEQTERVNNCGTCQANDQCQAVDPEDPAAPNCDFLTSEDGCEQTPGCAWIVEVRCEQLAECPNACACVMSARGIPAPLVSSGIAAAFLTAFVVLDRTRRRRR
jgi:hypothetical protein